MSSQSVLSLYSKKRGKPAYFNRITKPFEFVVEDSLLCSRLKKQKQTAAAQHSFALSVKKIPRIYRVVKQNLQVVKLVDSEHVNENMVQKSSPTCKHNLFTLIQSKKMFVECPGM